jgi:hypothetical protein
MDTDEVLPEGEDPVMRGMLYFMHEEIQAPGLSSSIRFAKPLSASHMKEYTCNRTQMLKIKEGKNPWVAFNDATDRLVFDVRSWLCCMGAVHRRLYVRDIKSSVSMTETGGLIFVTVECAVDRRLA